LTHDMRQAITIAGDSFIHSCTFDKTFAYEQFVPESVLAYQISGETQIYHQRGEIVLREGQVLLARRNQLAKSMKIPPNGGEYQCVCVLLTSDRLRRFALENSVVCEGKYQGRKNILFEGDGFFRGYFLSVMPYIQEWTTVNKRMAKLKVYEAVELLLYRRPDLAPFLFDFSDPRKTDLEEFMLRNFRFNTPVDHFARLSGRSLSAFKRDFMEIFNMAPATWLKNKRLSEAYYLIRQQRKKPQDIYLDLGFENLSHFYTSFKRKYGATPAMISGENK